MKCPKCFAETKVMDTRYKAKTNERMRRRECVDCGHRFTSWESTSPVPKGLKLEPKGWLEIHSMPFMGKVR